MSKSGLVTVVAEVAFAPETPKGVAYDTQQARAGRAVTGDTVILHRDRSDGWVEGGRRKVEIVVNGRSVFTKQIPADGRVHRIEQSIQVDQSSWVSIRHFPQLHSNPVNVIVNEKPIRVSRDSARWCIEMTELLWKNREHNIAQDEREAAKAAFEKALNVLRKIESES